RPCSRRLVDDRRGWRVKAPGAHGIAPAVAGQHALELRQAVPGPRRRYSHQTFPAIRFVERRPLPTLSIDGPEEPEAGRRRQCHYFAGARSLALARLSCRMADRCGAKNRALDL